MTHYLSLDAPQIDFWTLTSFDPLLTGLADQILLGQQGEHGRPSVDDARVEQYRGAKYSFPSGTIFVGEGIQEDMPHYLTRITGELAHEERHRIYNAVKSGYARVTRLDLQITTPEPRGWSQWALLERIHKQGRIKQWRESKDIEGRAETVYIGNRQSERFTRVYIKMTDGGERLLRLEVEYKGKRARAMGRSLAAGRTAAGYLKHELLNTLRDKPLAELFSPLLGQVSAHTERIQVESSLGKTEKWLLKQVLPAFSRVINDPQSSGHVAAMFLEVIEAAQR